MRDFRLTLSGWQSQGEVSVKIDDEFVQMKADARGDLVCDHQTEKDIINIKVYRMIDAGGALWFITQLFFFLITIFGLFGIHRREKCLAIDFETDVELRETNALTLKFNTPKDGARAVQQQTELRVREISNAYFTDAKVKKTFKILKIVKVFFALAVVALAIVITVASIINN